MHPGRSKGLKPGSRGFVALIQQLRAGREDAPTAEMLADAEVKLVTPRAVLESAKVGLGAKPLSPRTASVTPSTRTDRKKQ